MHTFNRWWVRHRLTVIVGGLTLAALAALRSFDVLPIRELYRWIRLPFQPTLAEQQQQQRASTLETQQRLQELEQRNQDMAALLKLPKIQRGEAIAATVIGRSADQWWQHLQVNQGSLRDLGIDAVVEAEGGLVGRVVKVTPSTSQVLLISDPSSRLAVLLTRSRSVGILRGARQFGGTLEFFDPDPDVKVGDAVVTSPLSCLFPPGIPVGTVKSIDRSKKAALEATVDFNVPLAQLEWVRLYQYEKTQTGSQAATSACP
ncbi:rod shape-determining protein MreC [Lyngbya confervoides]|uniref:Cell shape-determining protein MreC n=1 Tax=Lyngbya confervoides BDU141951 TaxID=1574623 RepID=A0ABD4T3G5_9CYAN|nr:rod shape-determining protein MreC [Lyngbya confervoides]MCM1982855.1 rod shape-determining protein MreC [Lyngbya confervoides BDU141951]